jgi:CheY-like chemotaxis protein
LGHEAQTAHAGLEALERAPVFKPDVVLLDIGMPGINGYDVCPRLRQEAWAKGIAVVALTGWGQSDDKRKSGDAGFDSHLVKPVDPDILARLLSAVGPGQSRPTEGRSHRAADGRPCTARYRSPP